MDTYQKEDNIVFDSPKNQSSYIKVIGVGGGGNNAVNHMFRQGISGVDFLVCNTDQRALNSSPVPNKILLGNGMGAGNNPAVAEAAAEKAKEEIKAAISNNTKMLFIAAGMGGGTGTGAAPVVAKLAKEITLEDGYTKEILVVAIVTMPFHFEGRKRQIQALEGLEKIRNCGVDAVLVINNDKLLKKSMPLPAAYACADDVLLTAAKGISEIMTVDSYINIDFEDVNTVMSKSGTALMGVGIGKGENRAKDAITMATQSELLNDNDISGAKDILLYISFSEKNVISTDELTEITDYITSLTGSDETNIIWGEGSDDSLEDEIKITLIATGFDTKKNESENKSKDMAGDPIKTPEPPVTKGPEGGGEPQIFPLYDHGEKIPGSIEIPSWNNNNGRTTSHSYQTEENDDGIQLIHKETPAVNIVSTYNSPSRQNYSSDNQEESITYRTNDLSCEEMEPLATPSNSEASSEKINSTPQYGTPSICKEIQTTAEERIKRMHDLLRNHPMGAEIVEQMTTEELNGEIAPISTPLSESEMPTSYLDKGGQIHKQDGFLDNSPD